MRSRMASISMAPWPSTVRFSIRFSYFSPLTTRCTKMPGVMMASGSKAPAGTISSTSAMVTFAAMAIMGAKLRAVLR